MNSFYIVHFMIFGLDSEYCTILDTNFIIKIMRESGEGGGGVPLHLLL